MADDDSSTTSDESVDVNSDKFDPIKAIYSTKIRLPSTSAPIYDNVSMFESRMKNIKQANQRTQTENDAVKAMEYRKQRFHSIQGPRKDDDTKKKERTIGRGKKEIPDVLTKMPNISGPLGMLYECMETRKRIRVYTRNAYGIRGHVEAYVAAFDKHWNLALEDCFEVWTRKRKKKAPAALADITDMEKTTTMMMMMMRTMEREKKAMEEKKEKKNKKDEEKEEKEVEEKEKENEEGKITLVPKVVLKKIEGKTETLERHVPQMLLRGEQVAIIVKIN